MFDLLQRAFDAAQTAIFESVVQPLLFAFGWMQFQEDAYGAIEWVLFGAIQIGLIYALLRPLEARRPAEPWRDRHGLGTDVIYTLLHRLGALPLLVFMLVTPLAGDAAKLLRQAGVTPVGLDDLWPGVTDVPLVSFVLYLVVLDFADYWLHRAQHRLRWWWALHALHHSQQKMSFWADSRNHLLDTLLLDAIKAVLALLIGVAPEQFVGLVIATRALQNLQHANLRWSFGPLGRWIVSPLFHRRHHAIGFGHEGRAYGCNFATLFPMWDRLFGTADFDPAVEPTGIRDQMPAPDGSGRDYGRSFWAQQWLGVRRLFRPAA
jgi:sterol desaturase/sphingolipid hydroxylase (fatty acid hydroxylase superfamily)